MNIPPWDIEKFGRIKVMLTLVEQMDGGFGWESHNKLLDTLPWPEEQKAEVFRDSKKVLGKTKLTNIFDELQPFYEGVITGARTRLEPEHYCCDQCTESIKGEIEMMQDRLDYIKESREQL